MSGMFSTTFTQFTQPKKVVILAWKWNVCNSHCQDYISTMQLRLNGCTSSIKHYLRGREGREEGRYIGKGRQV